MRAAILLSSVALVSSCTDARPASSASPEPSAAPSGTSQSSSSGAASSSGASSSGQQPEADASSGPTPLRFIVVGDVGKGTADQKKVAATMVQFCATRGCDFVWFLGDNIYPSGISSPDDPQMKSKFEDLYGPLNIDVFAVLGNHDYGANGLGTDFARGMNEVEYTAKSPHWKMPAPHYRLTKGAVEFFALDTNLVMFGRDDDQRAVVPAWVAQSTAEWKIAVGHHPYLSNGPHGNAGDYDRGIVPTPPPVNGASVKSFYEGTVCGKVDLLLTGHDHSRQWLTDTCKGTALAVSGAGAEGTELKGKNPTRFQSNKLGFLYLSILGKKLDAEFVDDAGATDFSYSITKP
jgi:tartrate-resistant acid phosphatase type 5